MRIAIFEILESRRHLSATGHPITLTEQAGQSFTAALGILKGNHKNAALTFDAAVNWGDGTDTDSGTVTLSSGVISVAGTHTYATARKYNITVTVTASPAQNSGSATPMFLVLIATLHDKAVVSAESSSTGGVTLSETAGQKFTANIGTFTTIAPATHLQAKIDWGDRSSSSGVLNTVQIVGLDEIEFAVDGSHAYANPGTYNIVISITQPALIATSSVRAVATIDSTAEVSSPLASLNGTITGTYSYAPVPIDVGADYVFSGSGSAGAVNNLSASGSVILPGLITSGNASGTLTLTSPDSAKDSITLALTGPTEAGFGPFPSTLNYAVTSATGQFAGLTGSGTIAVTLSDSSARSFTFILTQD